MVWATFLRIPIDFHEIPSMPKPLQNTIEMKKNQKMKNKLKFHDFSSQLRKTLPKPLQNGSLPNFKKTENFQNILKIFCFFDCSQTL